MAEEEDWQGMGGGRGGEGREVATDQQTNRDQFIFSEPALVLGSFLSNPLKEGGDR